MDIVIVTTAKTDAEAKALLKRLRHAVRQLIARGDQVPMAKKSSIEKNTRRAKLAKQIRRAGARG